MAKYRKPLCLLQSTSSRSTIYGNVNGGITAVSTGDPGRYRNDLYISLLPYIYVMTNKQYHKHHLTTSCADIHAYTDTFTHALTHSNRHIHTDMFTHSLIPWGYSPLIMHNASRWCISFSVTNVYSPNSDPFAQGGSIVLRDHATLTIVSIASPL